MARRPNRRYCPCGSGTLRWERTGRPAIWIGTCNSPACGEITIPSSQKEDLAQFLGARPRPEARPWTRLFVRAAQADGVTIDTARCPCDVCGAQDFLFQLGFYPLQHPNWATLCVACGAIDVRGFSEYGRRVGVVGGSDWANPDEAILTLRRGIREREAYEPASWET